MADETMNGTHGFRDIIRGGAVERLLPSDYDILTLSVGGNTAKAGHIVTIAGETYPACDLAITTDEHAYGIILAPVYPDNITNYDIDTAITDGELVRVLKVGYGRKLGVQVAVFLEATAGPLAVVPGTKVVIGTEAGKVRKYVYGDAASETDTLEELVGTAAEADAGSAADDHILIIDV